MVVGVLVLQPGVNRLANMGLSLLYAITIAGGAIGEWSYCVLGSAVEVGLLGAIAYYARTWPTQPQNPSRPVGRPAHAGLAG